MKRKTVEEGMASLPEELLYQILLLVPPAQLIELKFVCKSWFRLIDSPDFAESHIRRGMSQSGIVFPLPADTGAYDDVNYVSFDHIDGNEIRTRKLGLAKCLRDNHRVTTDFFANFRVFDSFRGLLVVGIQLPSEHCECHFLVWNPVTRSSMLVPACSNRLPWWNYRVRVHITYDPSVHRYKLVFISKKHTPDGVWECYVIELVGGKRPSTSWKELMMPLEAGHVEASVSAEGKVHWLVQMGDRLQQLRLCTLDLATEMFKVIDCSPAPFLLDRFCYLCAFNGTFYCLEHLLFKGVVKQWMLEDFEKPKWSTHPLIILLPPQLDDVSLFPVAVLDKGSKVVFLNMLRCEVAVYKVASVTWRIISLVAEDERDVIGFWDRVGHSDSLVSPMS